jgi:hypothetical protein
VNSTGTGDRELYLYHKKRYIYTVSKELPLYLALFVGEKLVKIYVERERDGDILKLEVIRAAAT